MFEEVWMDVGAGHRDDLARARDLDLDLVVGGVPGSELGLPVGACGPVTHVGRVEDVGRVERFGLEVVGEVPDGEQ